MKETKARPISEAMTPNPHGIAPGESVAVARDRMRDLRIHHLPVRSGGVVIGVISERDIDLVATFRDVDLSKTRVESIMMTNPYTVRPEQRLGEVAAEMAKRRIGSALVVDDDDHLLGIFTDTDALNELAQY